MTRSGKEIYLRLLRHVAPYWRTFALALFAMVVLAATEPAIPAIMKPLLDGSFVDRDPTTVEIMAPLLALLFLVKGAAAYLSSLAMAWVSGKVVMDLRAQMFDKLVTLPARYYDHHPSGTLISKVTFDASQVTEAATHVVTVLVRDTLAVAGLIGWMLYLDWRLTLIALISAPIIVLIVKVLSKRLRDMSLHLQGAMGDVTHVLEEAIDGQRVVRVFGGQDYERARFKRAINWARRYQVKFASAAAASSPVAQFVTALALAIIIYIAAQQSAAGGITVGGFVSFFTAMAMLFGPLKRLTGVNAPLQRGIAAASSVFALVDEASETDHGTKEIEHAKGDLELRGVSFAYGAADTPAIRSVSLRVKPGETVALVGPSGSGKTTLVNLIPRFYPLTGGNILLDGVDTSALTLSSLRRQISLVSQDIVLFNDTVAANIAYGPLKGARREEIEEAATAAHALEFIREMPEGLDTLVGENGVRLSGGQRQRLAIARAFLKNAPILILDEATSALDTASERHIQSAIETLRQGRTTIVIAHRLSTIENADRIVVMAEGEVLDVGTHAQLLKTNKLYAGLYRFQFSRDEEGEAAAG